MAIDTEVSWGTSSALALSEIYAMLGPERCQTLAAKMLDAGDVAFEEYKGDRQTKGKIRKGYYDWARKLRQVTRDGGAQVSFDPRDANEADMKADAPLGDTALKEEPPAAPVDPLTALLDEAVSKAAPTPSKPVDLSSMDVDQMTQFLDQDVALVARRKEMDAFVEAEAKIRLKRICATTDARELLTLCVPELVEFGADTFLFLSSATFTYKGSVFVRNCVVDEQSVKVGHDAVYRLMDNTRSHFIRSATIGEGGQKNRYVKVLNPREGMLIRYFTQVDGSNRDGFAWYGVIRSKVPTTITYGEYKTLEAELKKDS